MTDIKLTGEIFYLITDNADGSASLQLFKTKEAQVLYLDIIEKTGVTYDLSEGGGSINQTDIDSAFTVSDVPLEFE